MVLKNGRRSLDRRNDHRQEIFDLGDVGLIPGVKVTP